MINLNTRELRLCWDLANTLLEQRTLPEMITEAYGPLRRLIAVDHGAVCVGRAGSAEEYDWFGADLPADLFAGYSHIATHDFVRQAAVAQPNRVVRDDEMLTRSELERSTLYQSCRERGLVLEQIMTVLIPIEGAIHGGLTLYRGRRRPFSDRDRALLQHLAPTLASALRNHCRLDQLAGCGAALDALLSQRNGAAILIYPPSSELWRTDAVGPLLDRWFSPVERSRGGIPQPLLNELHRAAALPAGAFPPEPWVRSGKRADLRASLILVPREGLSLWLLVLEEVRHMPPAWSKLLTPRECEVVECVLRGWDNQTIADELHCTIGTVKKHLQRVFDALGVSSRAQLLNRARGEC